MKKAFYILILFSLCSINANAFAFLNGYNIEGTPTNTNGTLKVTPGSATNFRIQFSLTRDNSGNFDSYILQVVHINSGNGSETVLKEVRTSQYPWNSAFFISGIFDVVLPADKQEGEIGVKFAAQNGTQGQFAFSNFKYKLVTTTIPPVTPPVTPSVPGVFPIDGVTGSTTNGPSGTIGIYSWGITPGGSHFLNQHQSTSNNYYVYEGLQFYAFSSQTPGTVPIHRLQAYYQDGVRTNFYSTGTSGDGFFQYVGIAFYAFTTQVPGTVPIYCYTNKQGRDHYFTTGINHPYWVQKHIAFYAYPSNWQG